MEKSSPARVYVRSASTKPKFSKGKVVERCEHILHVPRDSTTPHVFWILQGSVRYIKSASQIFTPNAFSNILLAFQVTKGSYLASHVRVMLIRMMLSDHPRPNRLP